MLVVGLTGGIGSGKSTVAALFAAKSVPIIDTDMLARDITQPGQPTLDKIVEIFGKNMLLPDGHLDRARLRKLVFSNEQKRKQLEDLLHPLIRDEIKSKAALLEAPYCIVMIPLLFETPPNPFIQRILVVDASEELQISRTTLRDRSSKDDVSAILKTQANREKRLRLTDDVIVNDGLYEDLIPQVDKLHELYLSLAK